MTGKNQPGFLRHLSLAGFIFLVFFAPHWSFACSSVENVMPKPASLKKGTGEFRMGAEFEVAIDRKGNGRLIQAVNRMRRRLAGRTGIFFNTNGVASNHLPGAGGLFISYERAGKLELHEDESYSLTITPESVILKAVTDIGAMRGIETLLQLLSADSDGYYFPAVSINDRPRFPWRGLLIDSCRHFMPLEVVKRNLDGMSAVKLNVLHWHLTEDQGFRVECKTFPKLHRLGSDGLYYTHEQIKEVIRYAGDRGIRVVPEFDIPGHSTSWLVGYPELASAPGPYTIERGYGVKDPTFDPTRKATYKFFNKFFKEMASLFPDEYIHIGGDENNGKQWNGNPNIQAFMKKHRLKDNHALQAYFNKKIVKILTKYNKKMVGWDEIFQPYLPKNIVIQSWRGTESLRDAAKKGYMGLLSRGYYIDLSKPASYHYLNDPIPPDTELAVEEQTRVLGGEATMWAELVSPETVDSRIWPRTAAIAERFWSPANVGDVEDMYRRLEIVSLQLEEHGRTHIKNREMMLRRLAGGLDIEPLKVFLGAVEPLKGYARHHQGATYTFFSPLTRVVDAATPDAAPARVFKKHAASYLAGGDDAQFYLQESLEDIAAQYAYILIDCPPNLGRATRMALVILSGSREAASDWRLRKTELLDAAKKPRGHTELMVVDAIRQLVEAAQP